MLTAPSGIFWTEASWMTAPFGGPHGNPLLEWERSVALDVDGDGSQEIFVSTSPTGSNNRPQADSPLLVLGWRDGVLADVTAQVLPAGFGTELLRGFQTGDINGDGIMDLFLEDTGTEGIFPFPGAPNRLLLSDGQGGMLDGTGNLPGLTDFSHGSVMTDFDGDGYLDIYVNNLRDDDGVPSYLLLGDGSGAFSEPQFAQSSGGFDGSPRFDEALQSRGTGYFPALIDWGNDGDWDLHFGPTFEYVGGVAQFLGHSILVNDGSGNFTQEFHASITPPLDQAQISSGTFAGEMTRWGDIDGDGDLDLVVYWDATGTAFLLQLLENGPGGYSDVSHRIEGQANGDRLDPLAGQPDFQLVDMDSDGDLDIVLARWTPDFSARRVEWFANDGNGHFTRIAEEAFPAGQFFIMADVNGDGIIDVVGLEQVWNLPNSPEFDLGGHLAYVRLGYLDRAGSGEADTLVGSDLSDTLRGLDGDDVLGGGAGGDSLNGGAGNDTVAGAAGDDMIQGGGGRDNVGGGLGNDRISGGADDDTMGGGQGNDSIEGDSGNDVLAGGAGDDRLDGGIGNDTGGGGLGSDTILGGDGNDSIGGGAGRDLLQGGSGDDSAGGGEGDDTIEGGEGNDFLAGGGRNDLILGGDGRDGINGGLGDDTLTGGAGRDTFIFNEFVTGEVDAITDFEDGIDLIRLRGVGSGTQAERFEALDISVSGGAVMIEHEGHTILLEGVSLSELTRADFVFL